jgi:hypothetical protein
MIRSRLFASSDLQSIHVPTLRLDPAPHICALGRSNPGSHLVTWTSEGSHNRLHFVWLNLDNVLALMPKIGQGSPSEDAATDGRIEGAISSHPLHSPTFLPESVNGVPA